MEEKTIKDNEEKKGTPTQVTARVTPEKKIEFEKWFSGKGLNQATALNMAIDQLMEADEDLAKECDFSKEKKRVSGLTESINNIFDEIEKIANEQLQQVYLNNDNYNEALNNQVETLTSQLNQKEDMIVSNKETIAKQELNIENLSKEIAIKDSNIDSKTKLIDSFKLNMEQFDAMKKELAEVKAKNEELAKEHDDHIVLATEYKNLQKEFNLKAAIEIEHLKTIKDLEKQVAMLTKNFEIENIKNADKQAIIDELKATKKVENNVFNENNENIDKIGDFENTKGKAYEKGN